MVSIFVLVKLTISNKKRTRRIEKRRETKMIESFGVIYINVRNQFFFFVKLINFQFPVIN